MDEYTGVPVAQLREQISENLRGRSKRWLSEATGIDPRELDRIMDKAPARAIIGLDKSDRILMAFHLNLTQLEMSGEINVVPLGSHLTNAKKMAEDIFWVQNRVPHLSEVLSMARILLNHKKFLLGNVATA